MKHVIFLGFLGVAALFTLVDNALLEFTPVRCAGVYANHLQGVCTNEKDAIYWSFTTSLVKTNAQGNILKKVPVANHHGDLCFYDGKVYVAVNLGRFNDPKGNADSWVYVYNAHDLSLLAKHKTPEVFHGAGGIAHDGKRFLVVGGLPNDVKENYLYEYETEFRFVKKHALKSGHTYLGIQTAAYDNGHWWFGCYGTPKILLKADAALKKVERFEFDCSLGIVPIGDGKFLLAKGSSKKGEGHRGELVIGQPDAKLGMRILKSAGK